MGTHSVTNGDRSERRTSPSPKFAASDGGRHVTFHALAVVSIAVLCLATYSNSLHGPFVLDDDHNIVENRGVRWTSLSWSELVRTARESRNPSRLVAYASFAVNYYFGQYNVWGYHIVNVGIHLLNSGLVYLLALATLQRAPPRQNRRLPPSVSHWIALTAALIFVSHPIQTQAVTYIVQRMTSLCVLFYLAALLLYIYGRIDESHRRRCTLWTGSCVCWVLALGTKQIATTLPLTILLYEWYFFQDLSAVWVKKNAKFGLLTFVLLGVVAWAYLGNQPLDKLLAGYAQRDFTLAERVLTQFRVVIFYLSLLVFPHPSKLNLAHSVVTSQSLVQPITTLVSMVSVFGLLGLAIYLACRHRVVSFCLLWFFLHLVIESSVIALEMVFEHRLYLPMFGFSLLVAWLLYALADVRSWWTIGVAAVICLLLGVGTYQRNRVWQDAVTLWSDAVSKSPQSFRAHNDLGSALQDLGRSEESIAHYQEALRIKPDYPEVHYNWGLVLQRLGRFEEALAQYQKALRIKPDYAEAHYNWGSVLHNMGRIEEAVAHYQEALRIKPDDPVAHNTKGNALQGLGRFEEALSHYRAALRIKPDYAEVHYNWGNALQSLGRFEEALAQYREAVRIKPDYAEAQHDWGNALQQAGRMEEAVLRYQEALRIKPDYAEAQYDWGNALLALGSFEQAVARYQEAVRIKPDYAEAHNNLGSLFARSGQLEDARKHFEHAVRLRPESRKVRDNLRKVQTLLRQKNKPAQP